MWKEEQGLDWILMGEMGRPVAHLHLETSDLFIAYWIIQVLSGLWAVNYVKVSDLILFFFCRFV